MNVLSYEEDAARFFREIRAHGRADPAGQFRSLAAACQYRLLYTLTAGFVRPPATVLDWGGGRGHFSYYLLKHGFTVTCYSLEDPPEYFSSLPREERDRLSFVKGHDPVALPFPPASFDAVFSVGVLEHVRESGGTEVRSLAEIRRVLVSDGVLIVYHLPNRLSHIEALNRLLYGRRYRDVVETIRFHRYRFSAKDIERLAEAAGFSLVDIGAYGFLPRNSFNRLPPPLSSSRRLASAVNVVDHALERMFNPFVQNRYFVARPART